MMEAFPPGLTTMGSVQFEKSAMDDQIVWRLMAGGEKIATMRHEG